MSDNAAIADQFSLLAKLMDIHGESSFKAKSYAVAAYTIERLPQALSNMDRTLIASQKGIGESTAKKILEILDTGKLQALEQIISKTPPGILEMMQIKGLGPKKIATIWKEMGIEEIGELLYACQENRLLLYKGFGEKTQQQVMEAIGFFLRHKGQFLYAEIIGYAESLERSLKEVFPHVRCALTGAARRQAVTLDRLEWVITAEAGALRQFMTSIGLLEEQDSSEPVLRFTASEQPLICLYLANEKSFASRLFETTAGEQFLTAWKSFTHADVQEADREEEIFTHAGVHYIPPYRREGAEILVKAKEKAFDPEISPKDIKGIIHAHSNWSDGAHTLEEMAKGCIDRGLEYLVISDHSKSAFYAGGLSEERIREQHAQIDLLNRKLSPFKIFRSIECDILQDGSLDYTNDVLAGFDLVIASVHANLKMTEEKAMQRLLHAIGNPYTTILGHLTGRLLLTRPGYPVDHLAIIEACAKNRVVIEINAHPRRLDMDWKWISVAMDKGVMLSIDPDAHATSGFDDVRYGVLAAQKGGLTKEWNLSSLSKTELENWLEKRRKDKNL